MRQYAIRTRVGAEKSRAEIERILVRYGADQFAYGWGDKGATIGFRAHGRYIKFLISMPQKSDAAFARTPGGRRTRSEVSKEKAWEQTTRQRWRALALVIKAKLEAVASGIAVFEEEFLAYIVMPGGKTVAELVKHEISEAYTSGKVKGLLPDFSGDKR